MRCNSLQFSTCCNVWKSVRKQPPATKTQKTFRRSLPKRRTKYYKTCRSIMKRLSVSSPLFHISDNTQTHHKYSKSGATAPKPGNELNQLPTSFVPVLYLREHLQAFPESTCTVPVLYMRGYLRRSCVTLCFFYCVYVFCTMLNKKTFCRGRGEGGGVR